MEGKRHSPVSKFGDEKFKTLYRLALKTKPPPTPKEIIEKSMFDQDLKSILLLNPISLLEKDKRLFHKKELVQEKSTVDLEEEISKYNYEKNKKFSKKKKILNFSFKTSKMKKRIQIIQIDQTKINLSFGNQNHIFIKNKPIYIFPF